MHRRAFCSPYGNVRYLWNFPLERTCSSVLLSHSVLTNCRQTPDHSHESLLSIMKNALGCCLLLVVRSFLLRLKLFPQITEVVKQQLSLFSGHCNCPSTRTSSSASNLTPASAALSPPPHDGLLFC